MCRHRSKRWLLLTALLLEMVSFHALNLRTSTVSKTFSKWFLFYLKADSLQIISSFFGAGFRTLKAPHRALRNKSDPKCQPRCSFCRAVFCRQTIFMCKQQPARKRWQNKSHFWNHWPPNPCLSLEWLNLGYHNNVKVHDALCNIFMGSAATVSDLRVIACFEHHSLSPDLGTQLGCSSWLKGAWSDSVKGCWEENQVHD